MPIAAVTQTALYFGSTKLAPIKKGDAILRQPIGTLKLQADGASEGWRRSATSCVNTKSYHDGDGVRPGASATLPMPL